MCTVSCIVFTVTCIVLNVICIELILLCIELIVNRNSNRSTQVVYIVCVGKG